MKSFWADLKKIGFIKFYQILTETHGDAINVYLLKIYVSEIYVRANKWRLNSWNDALFKIQSECLLKYQNLKNRFIFYLHHSRNLAFKLV